MPGVDSIGGTDFFPFDPCERPSYRGPVFRDEEIDEMSVATATKHEREFYFDPKEHVYRIGGWWVPSVTQVIRSEFRMKSDEFATEWHLGRGTAIHAACALVLRNQLDWSTVDPEIEPRLRAFQQFVADWKSPAPKVIEEAMFSKRFMFAGQTDAVFLENGGLTVLDWKSAMDARVQVQLGAYSCLLREYRQLNMRKGVGVELRADGTYKAEWYPADALREGEQTFLAALTTFNFRRNKLKETERRVA